MTKRHTTGIDLKDVQAWLDKLKHDWESIALPNKQQDYWRMMTEVHQQASEKLLEEWRRRAETTQAIQTMHELYELWLDYCHQAQQKILKSSSFQDAYGEWMNATAKLWQSVMPK